MSRSIKRKPVSKDCESGKWGKKQANRKVRREKEFSGKGKQYKKIYNSWNIHDFVCYWTLDDAIKDWYNEEKEPTQYQWRHKQFKTLENWINYWKKCMIRK